MRRLAYTARLMAAACTDVEAFLPRTTRPMLAVINLTENCQARCLSCNYWTEKKDNLISTQRAIDLVHELAAEDVKYLRWAGGEPLLRPDLFRVLEHVPRDRFSKIILGTNGKLIGQFAEEINESCISQISVSLEGIGDTQLRLRGIEFDTVWNGLRAIRGKRIKVTSLLTKHLAKDIDDLLDLCDDRGYDHDICLPSGVLPYSNSEAVNRNLSEMWPSSEDVDRVLSALLRRRKISRSIAEGARGYMINGTYPARHCILGYTDLRITANGDVYTSCFELGAVGNILRAPLHTILRDHKATEITRKMYRLNCSTCLVGWQTSRVFERPWINISYVNKRTRRTPAESRLPGS